VRANAYIDGFNLYYGALRERPDCKWLDLRKMCTRLLPPDQELHWVRYFTARVGGPRTDPHQSQRQDVYLRALEGENMPFSLHEGHFQTETALLPLVNSEEKARVRIRKEKGSDVNLAAQLVVDACEGEMDTALVITDDFDQEGALKIVREQCGITLVVASPRDKRNLARTVRADFYKTIREQLLLECQFSDMVLDQDGREVFRPRAWRSV